jgi:hypothetical protein
MFVISALMTIPVAISGVFLWPGTPAKPNKLFLSDHELALAVKRLKDVKADAKDEVQQSRTELLKQIFSPLVNLFLECRRHKLRWLSPLAQELKPLLHPKSQPIRHHSPGPRYPLRPLRKLQLRPPLGP